MRAALVSVMVFHGASAFAEDPKQHTIDVLPRTGAEISFSDKDAAFTGSYSIKNAYGNWSFRLGVPLEKGEGRLLGNDGELTSGVTGSVGWAWSFDDSPSDAVAEPSSRALMEACEQIGLGTGCTLSQLAAQCSSTPTACKVAARKVAVDGAAWLDERGSLGGLCNALGMAPNDCNPAHVMRKLGNPAPGDIDEQIAARCGKTPACEAFRNSAVVDGVRVVAAAGGEFVDASNYLYGVAQGDIDASIVGLPEAVPGWALRGMLNG